MRQKLWIPFIVFVSILLLSGIVHAHWATNGWIVQISGEREDYKPYVMIGLAKENASISNPPEPMGFKCNIMVKSIQDNNYPLNRDIRQYGLASYEWIIAVNPHGEGQPFNATCSLKWNPYDLGPGKTQLLDFSGNVLIQDMKQTSSYLVSSNTNTYLYYKLQYQEISLVDIINNIQLLAGFKNGPGVDVDLDGVIKLNDIISVLKYVASQ
jgi:hypothetical protein